jgi:hypothetical protein
MGVIVIVSGEKTPGLLAMTNGSPLEGDSDAPSTVATDGNIGSATAGDVEAAVGADAVLGTTMDSAEGLYGSKIGAGGGVGSRAAVLGTTEGSMTTGGGSGVEGLGTTTGTGTIT